MKIMANKKRFLGIAAVVLAAGILNSSWIFYPSNIGRRSSPWNLQKGGEEKKGVLVQTRFNNCGPTALQMIFDYYKVPSTIDEIERNIPMTENGATMLALKQMAELKGLHAEGWRLTLNDFANSSFPLLLFVHNDHFVVADSICNDIVFLRDPAIGKLRMPAVKLLQIWHGEALVFKGK